MDPLLLTYGPRRTAPSGAPADTTPDDSCRADLRAERFASAIATPHYVIGSLLLGGVLGYVIAKT